jgi:DNA-binding response OmpR family regulator
MSLRDQQSGLILLVEDNHPTAETTGVFLERRGYSVDYAADGIEGLSLAASGSYDAMVLGLRLPGIDGLEVCRKLRGEVRKCYPIVMLAARDTLDDKIAGLDAGADDYMVKPFEIRELDARLYALIRRNRRQVSSEKISVGNMTLDPETLRTIRGGRELFITPTGIKLLTVLMRESPRVVSRRDIEREIWGDMLPDSDTLRSHIYNLREVIDRPFDRPLLHTVASTGYRMADLSSGKNLGEVSEIPCAPSAFDYVRFRTDGNTQVTQIDSYRSASGRT